MNLGSCKRYWEIEAKSLGTDLTAYGAVPPDQLRVVGLHDGTLVLEVTLD